MIFKSVKYEITLESTLHVFIIINFENIIDLENNTLLILVKIITISICFQMKQPLWKPIKSKTFGMPDLLIR